MEQPRRKYTTEEKEQLVANLRIEVAHKTRQFEAWLADALQSFCIHQEGQISRIPKPVRNLTMREFAEKYNGDVQEAMRGIQREKLGGGLEPGQSEADKWTRKRKWITSHEAEGEVAPSTLPQDVEHLRASKNIRMSGVTPKKKPGSSTGPGTAQRAKLMTTNRTPSNSRINGHLPLRAPSPSPQKSRQPFSTSTYPRQQTRPTSPTKPIKTLSAQPRSRVPSSSTFNPALPPKTPAYPGKAGRLPRRDESMLSLNGSPLANPYELGVSWFKDGSGHNVGGEDEAEAENPGVKMGRTVRRTNSIIIRREASSAASNGYGHHSRTNSQTSNINSSQSSTFPQINSDPQIPFPSSSQSQLHVPTQTPRPPSRSQTHNASAFVAIPTKDGHLLEFDPLQTSPGTLDALEGITLSSKKQAKLEMGRLMQAAVDKWAIK